MSEIIVPETPVTAPDPTVTRESYEAEMRKYEAEMRKEGDRIAMEIGKTVLIGIQNVYTGKCVYYSFPLDLDVAKFEVSVKRTGNTEKKNDTTAADATNGS